MARDLKDALPDMRGWSSSNLKFTRFIAQHCPDANLVSSPLTIAVPRVRLALPALVQRSVTGPSVAIDPAPATADHVGQRRESAARLELDRRADGVADGQAQQRASSPVLLKGHRLGRIEVAAHAPVGCGPRATASWLACSAGKPSMINSMM